MGVVIASRPYIEPLIEAALQRRWLVALVRKRTARFLTGDGEQFEEQEQLKDRVHGYELQGGGSQDNYQRSVEDDAEHHFQRVAELLGERWRAERFDRLALGGTAEEVARLEPKLDGETRTGLLDMRVSVEVEHATPEQVADAMRELVEEDAAQDADVLFVTRHPDLGPFQGIGALTRF